VFDDPHLVNPSKALSPLSSPVYSPAAPPPGWRGGEWNGQQTARTYFSYLEHPDDDIMEEDKYVPSCKHQTQAN